VPIIVTFDLSSPRAHELNRFAVCSSDVVGARREHGVSLSAADEPDVSEDWLNRVVPPLMMLRALACHAAATGRAVVGSRSTPKARRASTSRKTEAVPC